MCSVYLDYKPVVTPVYPIQKQNESTEEPYFL